MNSRTADVSLALVASLACLIVGELALRATVSRPPVARFSETLFAHDPVLGWGFLPNRSVEVLLPEGIRTRATINASGMRDDDVARTTAPEGTHRIAVLGDSFVAGLEVDDSEVFTEVLEHELLENVQVLNFGVSGYGPQQSLLRLEREALDLRPDIVMFLFYAGNDIDDLDAGGAFHAGYRRPTVEVSPQDEVVLTGIPVPRPRIWSRALYRLRGSETYLLGLGLLRRIGQTLEARSGPRARDERPQAHRRLEAVLRRMRDKTQESGALLVVLGAPTSSQVLDRAVEGPGPAQALRLVESACLSLAIPWLDLTPALRAAAASGEEPFLPIYRHWTPAAHRVVAREILEFLESRGLPRDGRNASEPGPMSPRFD